MCPVFAYLRSHAVVISHQSLFFFPSSWPGIACSTLLPLSMPPGNRATQEAGILAARRPLASSTSIFRVASLQLVPGFLSFPSSRHSFVYFDKSRWDVIEFRHVAA